MFGHSQLWLRIVTPHTGVLNTIALLLRIVIECYDEDMHIWSSSGLIGNFSQVRMTHDKHYWQSQLQVKTSSWLKLSLCPLLRVVITMAWCELIGSLSRRKFIGVPSQDLHVTIHGDSWPSQLGRVCHTALVLSDPSRNITSSSEPAE